MITLLCILIGLFVVGIAAGALALLLIFPILVAIGVCISILGKLLR